MTHALRKQRDVNFNVEIQPKHTLVTSAEANLLAMQTHQRAIQPAVVTRAPMDFVAAIQTYQLRGFKTSSLTDPDQRVRMVSDREVADLPALVAFVVFCKVPRIFRTGPELNHVGSLHQMKKIDLCV